MPRKSKKLMKPPSKPKICVLSLFDGIGAGYHALRELKLDIESYYASEIDKNALQVTCHHFGNSINQLGCVKTIKEETIGGDRRINLLIGGSPCLELSCVNANRKGMYDVERTGLLFFEFYRIKTVLDKKGEPYYWMFENVAGMEIENKNTISKFLGCEPVTIDSVCMSAQSRKRFYWTNLPGAAEISKKAKGSGPTLDTYLDENLGRQPNTLTIGTITTNPSCLQNGSSRDPVTENGLPTGLYITEIEKIFGFPAHYTDVGNMSKTDRQKLLGRTWSVPVIKALFEPLTKVFATIE